MKGSSILASLGIHKRVLLRDVGHEDSPVLRVSSPEAPPVSMAQERYQIVGEIARGGIGVVLKGRDVDLGRDVAMKVLRPEHARNADLVDRFVEEAQIEGQLQHPGIVPVYELGLRDKRPYFTMKLVRGQTLAALLAARADPAQDRRRFLGIFAQVCQTMAYAHARGVLHRDLKPSNVMVGAFGEVLVVDWGFAKVMQQEERQRDLSVVRTTRTKSGSGSLAGSVVGTPAYMPPEQALGEAAGLDARADVFSLGAILCEILTGAPPYGGQGSDPLLQASRAEIQDALARLDACGAEAELVAVAKACLAPARGERPADAGVVAKRVGDHLAAVEERARRAQVEAAEATVRARGDRKARRLTIGLASAVAIALVGGGMGWWRLESDRRDRADARATRVRQALAEAAQRRGQAQGLGLAGWEGASGAARAAVALAQAPETPVALRDEAARFAAHVDEDAAAARAEAEQTRRDAEAVARLTEVRAKGVDSAGRADEYAAAFRDVVGDIADEGVPGRIAASAIRTELCAALDDWASLGRDDALRIYEILGIADPDPWRTDVRAAGRARDSRRLLALASAVDPAEEPAISLALLARSLAGTGEVDAAIALLRRSVPHHPDEIWLHVLLGRWLVRPDIGAFDEAVRHLRAALALRPQSTEIRHQLGIALERSGRNEEAVAVWRDALDLDPSYKHAHVHIFGVEQAKGTLGARIAELSRAADAAPGDGDLWLQLGLALHVQRDWKAAAEALERAAELDPSCIEAEVKLGEALLRQERAAEARERLERLVKRLPRRLYEAWRMLGRARGATGDARGAIEAYTVCIEESPGIGEPWNDLAGALLLDGQVERAADACRESLRRAGNAWSVHDVASALFTAGRQEDAQALCVEAVPVLRRGSERADGEASWFALTLGRVLCDFLLDDDNAVAAFQRAIEVEPRNFAARLFLGVAHGNKGDPEAAIAAFQGFFDLKQDGPQCHLFWAAACRRRGDPDQALAHCREAQRLRCPLEDQLDYEIGCLLLGRGELDEGFACLRRCAGRGRDTAACEEFLATLTRVAPLLPAVMAGKAEPGGGREALALAWLADSGAHWRAGAALYRRAFELEPALLFGSWPFHPVWRGGSLAAACAAYAGAGRGTDAPAPEEERAALRAQARAWLSAELEDWRQRIDSERDAARKALWMWKRNPDLALVRAPGQLALLPEAERAAWQRFWQEVDDLLARTRP